MINCRTVRKVGAAETLVICGDLNGHIGKLANGYEGVTIVGTLPLLIKEGGRTLQKLSHLGGGYEIFC